MKAQKIKSITVKIHIEFFIKLKEKIMNTHFKTHYNRELFPGIFEVSKEPSLTVPDQSMSVKTILDRFAKGLPLGGQRVPIYEGEDAMPDMTHMDLADRQELMELAEQEIKDLQEKVRKNRALHAAAQTKQQLEYSKVAQAAKLAEKKEDSKEDSEKKH